MNATSSLDTCNQPPEILRAPSEKWTKAQKPVLLTFDDGPHSLSTPMILDTLSAYQIKAIFFVVGEEIEKPQGHNVVRRIVSEGHMTGNHSYSHADLLSVSQEQFLLEIEQTQNILASLGTATKLFRPPFGNISKELAMILSSLGFWALGWNVNPFDWKYRSDEWIDCGLQQASKNKENIVVLHDIHPTTASNLKTFIEGLLALGCTFPPLFSHHQLPPPEQNSRWTEIEPGWMVLKSLPLFRPHQSTTA